MKPQLDIEKIKRAIKEIKKIDLQITTIEELETLLEPLFTGYQVSAPRFNPPVYLYRARRIERPSKLEEVYYPKPELIKKLGRINNIGEPFFYAATARSVPFFELDVQPGEHVTVACWKTKKPLLLNHVGFTKECKDKLNSNRDLSQIYEFVKNMANFDETNKLVSNFLASKFVEIIPKGYEHNYKTTIAIAKKLLMGNLLNGILYPTIAMSGNADNVVLKPDYADNNLEFVSVEHIKIKERNGMKIEIDVLDSATKIENNGLFKWSGRKLQWKITEDGGELQMKSEGGGWHAYDKYGNKVDPV